MGHKDNKKEPQCWTQKVNKNLQSGELYIILRISAIF